MDGDVCPDQGWVMDFGAVKQVVRPHVERLDHAYLNDIDGLANPTSENIARWLWARLKPELCRGWPAWWSGNRRPSAATYRG